MPTPGMLLVRSKITAKDKVSPELFTKWYEDVHIVDIFKTSGMKSAFRWECTDPSADRPYLAYYPMKDIAFLQTDEFKAIPVDSDILPGPSHNCFDIGDFDTRYYEHLHTYEPAGTKAGPGAFTVLACLEPADGTEQDFDDWYRREHIPELAKCTGYRRSRRYQLAFARQNRRPEAENELDRPPKYMAMHEFDGEKVPEEEIHATTLTPWSKKVIGGLKRNEPQVYKLLKGFGDVENRF